MKRQETTLNARRKKVLSRLESQLKSGKKPLESARLISGNKPMEDLSSEDRKRIEREINTIKDRLSGKKKSVKKLTKEGKPIEQKDKYFIDIFQISFAAVKHSDRRKNKGKSRKKAKKKKSVTFLKSVIAQPGMINAYTEGRMGLSPKTHTFRVRKEEISMN